jgi:transposase
LYLRWKLSKLRGIKDTTIVIIQNIHLMTQCAGKLPKHPWKSAGVWKSLIAAAMAKARPRLCGRIMRYELTDHEWAAIKLSSCV